MKEAIRHGYVVGGGLRSPDKKYFFLGIPKNASTYLSNTLLANGWHHHTLGNDSEYIQQMIVVLRDPIERWISGFGTYVSSWILGPGYGSDHFVQDYNELSERLIFESQILDDHTTPQARFIHTALEIYNPQTVHYVKLGSNTIKHISSISGQDLNIMPVDRNVSEENYDQKQVIEFIKDRLKKDFVLRSVVIKRFNEDYDLINNQTFYHDPR